MMPLTVASFGEEKTILKVGGSEKTRSHLNDLGFVPGANVTVISKNNGNLIVKMLESRIALDEMLAIKIMV